LSIDKKEEEKKRLVGSKKKKGDKDNSKSETAPVFAGSLPVYKQLAFFHQMTIAEMQEYRQEIADRSVIAAIKTIAELGRA
jgi:hypothetical protein